MFRIFVYIIVNTIFIIIPLKAQDSIQDIVEKSPFYILFYNTENTFDNQNDTEKNDEEFLPSGKRHWTQKRYKQKINNISKVIISVGSDPPTIIGLAEIENKKVLNDIIHNTVINNYNYKYLHHESPDARGIDVAMLYNSYKYIPIETQFISVKLQDSTKKTREILYSKGIALTDTVHIFVNHWPSRRGGQEESSNFRCGKAKGLRIIIDSIFESEKDAKIIIMGDFNDEPDDISLTKFLRAQQTYQIFFNDTLYNLSYNWLSNTPVKGTHKFKGKWGILDQIIVSGSILNSTCGINCTKNDAFIYWKDFLLLDDRLNGGKMPFKTYNGFKYNGGFSDHMPIILNLRVD